MSNTGKFRQNINAKITSNNKKDVSASKVRDVLTDAADVIDEIFETFSLVDGLGTYNASTGVATIKETGATFTPVLVANQANGKFFNIEVEGTQSITGSSKLMKVGGMLVSRGTKWDYIPPADTGFSKVVSIEETFQLNAFPDKLLPVFDNIGNLLSCFELDGSYFVGWYKDNSINGSGLKNGEITVSKLHQEVLNLIGNGSIGNASITLNKLAQETVNAFMSSAYRNYIFPLLDEKLCTLGDSISFQGMWQPTLAQLTGSTWSVNETRVGSPGATPPIPPMGVAGSDIIPFTRAEGAGYASGRGPGQSIYMRAGFVHLNNPKNIILWGGANTKVIFPGNALEQEAAANAYFGQPTDAAYTGGEMVEGDSSQPTFCAAYKGTLKKLVENNPSSKIYAVTRMYNTGISSNAETAYQRVEKLNNLIRECCKRYGIQVFDVNEESGIWSYNSNLYIPDGTHLNEEGGKRVGRLFAKKIN